jgi:hypothetical protein
MAVQLGALPGLNLRYLYLFVLVVGIGAALIDVASGPRVFSRIWD